MKNLLTLLILVLGMGLAAQNHVYLQFRHLMDNGEYTERNNQFTIWNDKASALERCRFYISEISLYDENGVELFLDKQYVLVDTKENGPYYAGEWSIDRVKKIRLHLGVDEPTNHQDPSNYPLGHPLAHQNPTMHWNWSWGYRFIAIEGAIDNNNDGLAEQRFEFHNIGDAYYSEMEFDISVQADNGMIIIPFDLTYKHLFDDMEMRGNLLLHGNEALNTALMDNMKGDKFMTVSKSATSVKDIPESFANMYVQLSSDHANIFYELFKNSDKASIAFMNPLGHLFAKKELEQLSGEVSFPISDFTPGIYYVALRDWDTRQMISKKIFIK